MGFAFHVTTRLAYMFVICALLLLVFTFFFGLQLGQGLALESAAKQSALAGASGTPANAATVQSSVRGVQSSMTQAQQAMKVPPLPTAKSLQSGVVAVEVGQ